jgi:cellulose biosynthesis protein BcsQ
MTESSRGSAGDVFGGAARANEYIEEAAIPGVVVNLPPENVGELDVIESRTTTDAPPAGAAPAFSVSVDSTSVLFGGPAAAAALADPGKATTGFRGAMARMGFPVGPGPEEVEARRVEALRLDAERIVRQATWTRAVSILVANPKGGTRKSPSSILLAGVLASIRGGSTAVLEVSDDPGALAFRAEGNPKLGLGELVRDLDQVKTAGRLHGYTAPQTSFADVISSTGRRPTLTGEAVVAVSKVIDEFYGIRVMDSGNQPTSSAFQGAVSVADVLVIPLTNAGDSTIEMIQLLEELRAAGGKPKRLADNAIALRITDGRPEFPHIVEEVTRLLDAVGVTSVFDIPYDAHIAARQQISLAELSPATRDAFTAAAAAVVTSLNNSVSTDL